MRWIIIVPMLIVSVCGIIYGIRLALSRREPIKPMLVIFAAAGGFFALMYMILMTIPGVTGGFITLAVYIVSLALVFLLFMLLAYAAICLCRYIQARRS